MSLSLNSGRFDWLSSLWSSTLNVRKVGEQRLYSMFIMGAGLIALPCGGSG